jgi:DNA-binding response OmpR family regulator
VAKHALVADDERHTRFALSLILRKAGFSVTVVENGTQALRTFVDAARGPSPFDLLILDVQLPGITGLELVEEIGRLGAKPPILLITGYDDSDELRKLQRRHCLERALKPFEPAELMRSVDRLLARFDRERPRAIEPDEDPAPAHQGLEDLPHG